MRRAHCADPPPAGGPSGCFLALSSPASVVGSAARKLHAGPDHVPPQPWLLTEEGGGQQVVHLAPGERTLTSQPGRRGPCWDTAW